MYRLSLDAGKDCDKGCAVNVAAWVKLLAALRELKIDLGVSTSPLGAGDGQVD